MNTSAAEPGDRDDDMDEAARKLDLALGRAIMVMRATRNGMTQEELARRSGISKKTIGRFETGSSMRMPQMLRIATALGIGLGELLEKAEELGG